MAMGRHASSALTLSVAAILAIGGGAASALGDAELQAVVDGFEERRDWALREQVRDPYPEDGVWHYADFALAALYLNERVDEANEAILTIHRDFPVDPDPEREPGEPDRQDFHWYINLLHRIWFLFAHDSDRFPGRLSTEAESALLDIFWDSARRHCRIRYADPEATWRIWGSENHGAMSWSGFWGTAQILSGQEDYRDRRYEDGSTPAEMAAAWDAFYREYARERASKGLLVEIASTYNKYTLQGWYNMADFAADPVLKRRMQMLLDLFWADWAIEQIDCVRGGSGHRIYPGRTAMKGVFSGGTGMAWFTFGIGPKSRHPGHMCCATSDYRPPLCVVDMALDVEGRGSYEYVSRRPGLNQIPKADDVDWHTYDLRPDHGGILRYTYATPGFVMGTSQIDQQSEPLVGSHLCGTSRRSHLRPAAQTRARERVQLSLVGPARGCDDPAAADRPQACPWSDGVVPRCAGAGRGGRLGLRPGAEGLRRCANRTRRLALGGRLPRAASRERGGRRRRGVARVRG